MKINYGYTLIEMMIGLAIMALVLFTTVPLTISWINGNSVVEMKDIIQKGYTKTKALALSNPSRTTDGTAVAYLCAANSNIYVQPVANATCGTGFIWSASIKSGVALTVSGFAFSCLGVNNLGRLIPLTVGSSVCSTNKNIVVAKGDKTDDRAIY